MYTFLAVEITDRASIYLVSIQLLFFINMYGHVKLYNFVEILTYCKKLEARHDMAWPKIVGSTNCPCQNFFKIKLGIVFIKTFK